MDMNDHPRETGDLERATDARLSRFYDTDDEAVADGDTLIFDELRSVQNRYEDEELIARGGLKCVNRVFDKKTQKFVAMARPRDDAPPEMYEPFLREARLTALLDHPNIISVHDMGVDDKDLPYFSMDLKVGDSLAQIIEKLRAGESSYGERYPLDVLLTVFVRVCDAVEYAHSRNVLHLDLKPANIQVGKFGEVLLCDWGLAKIIGSDDDVEFDALLFNPDLLNDMTSTGAIKGTPGYMAPEQAEAGQEKTARTDVFAMGAMLYSLLTQEAPFSGSTDEILEKTKQGRLTPPADIRPRSDIPKSLASVAMKAMSHLPRDRYTSVDEMRREVVQYLSGFATEAERAGFRKQLVLLYRRNRRVCQTVFAGVLIVAVVVAVFVGELSRRNYGKPSKPRHTRPRRLACLVLMALRGWEKSAEAGGI